MMIIPTTYFKFIDIAIILFFIFMIIHAYHQGFFHEFVSLLFTLISLAIAWFLSPVFAGLYPLVKIDQLSSEYQLFSKLLNINVMMIINIIIYFILIFLVLKLLQLILIFITKKINNIPILGTFNKIAGAFCGALNACIVVLLLSVLLTLPIFKNGNEVKKNTVFKYVDEYSQSLLSFIADNADLNKFSKYFEDFDIDLARDEFKKWLLSFNEE